MTIDPDIENAELNRASNFSAPAAGDQEHPSNYPSGLHLYKLQAGHSERKHKVLLAIVERSQHHLIHCQLRNLSHLSRYVFPSLFICV